MISWSLTSVSVLSLPPPARTMIRIIARRICVNVSGLRVIRNSFCSDAATKVSHSNCGEPSIESEVKQSVTHNDHQYDVAIVGGGMVGMALACSLANMPLTNHLNVAIIDSNPALGKLDCIKKEDPPDPWVSTVTPAAISFFKDIGAWQYVQQHRHAYVDKMQVWDYTGLGYTRYNGRDVNKEILGLVIQVCSREQGASSLSVIMYADFRISIYASRLTSMALLPSSSYMGADSSSSTAALFNKGCLTKLELSDGNSLYAKLVVGADGGKSRVRELAGFKTTGWSYSQSAITCTVEHPKENHCAWQQFLPTGPIAVLPAGDNFSNIVWTMNPSESLDLKSMNEDDFLKNVNHALDYGHGPHPQALSQISSDIWSWLRGVPKSADESFEVPPKVVKLASERVVFPLSLMHANGYASKRVVLIGDAAHTVHPLAGQGVNLGFGDASTLSRIIAEGIAVGSDTGEVSLLKKYEAERKPVNIMMMAVLDGFQKAYSVNFGPLNILRSAAFNGAQYITPLKRSIISYASGEQSLPLPLPLFS